MSVPYPRFLRLATAAMLAACSSGPAAPDVAKRPLTEAATPAYAPPVTYVLTAFDAETGVVSGTDGFGSSIAAPFVAGTDFRAALIPLFPNDPLKPYGSCTDAVVAYNGSLGAGLGDTGLFAAIGSLATGGCSARISLDRESSAVRFFQPTLPPNPVFPTDPT